MAYQTLILIDEELRKALGETRLDSFKRKHRDKTCFKTYNKLLRGDGIPDLELSIMVSSIITQSLLEMKKVDPNVYKDLYILEQSELLRDFVSGGISSEEVKRFYYEIYSRG